MLTQDGTWLGPGIREHLTTNSSESYASTIRGKIINLINASIL